VHEYETAAGARTASGEWLDSTVKIVAPSPETAWQKLVELHPGMHVVYPPVLTGRSVSAKS